MNEIQASKHFATLPEALQAYLNGRGGNYGIPGHDLLRKIPESLLDNPEEIYKYLKLKHISHCVAISEGGSPDAFNNWIFEDGASNLQRGNDLMSLEEYLDAQLDSMADARVIEFGTIDPQIPHTTEFSEFFGIEQLHNAPDFSEVGNAIEAIAKGSQAQAQAAEILQNRLFNIGVPVGYITIRGLRMVWPYLCSIQWQRLRTDGRYRNAVVSRTLMTFREGKWKEAAKAVVMGFLIAAFPPLSYMLSAVGLTEVASIGIRWLASYHNLLPSGVAAALSKIAGFLNNVAGFLKRVLVFAEKIVDIVIEAGTGAVKKIVQGGSEFISSVSKAASNIAKGVVTVAKSISSWVFGWFCRPAMA